MSSTRHALRALPSIRACQLSNRTRWGTQVFKEIHDQRASFFSPHARMLVVALPKQTIA